MKKMLILTFLGGILCGCTLLNRDFDKYGKNYKKIPLQLISIGDNKENIKEKLGEPVNVIGSKQFEEGSIEVWAYEKWDARMGWDVLDQEYWLYFLDDELAQWGRPGDWRREADKIYEFRVR